MPNTEPFIPKYGWKPDLPDYRDLKYTPPQATLDALPPSVDLRPGLPPVLNQGSLGSCTANAIAIAHQFSQRKGNESQEIQPSRLFIYYNERVMEGTVGVDAGAAIRDGVKSIVQQGVCPEDIWPYNISKFIVKPPDNCYVEAMKHQAIRYERITQDLRHMKACLASGYPFVFGFTVYQSFESPEVAQTGAANLPSGDDTPVGGHAVLAVGYDDSTQRFLVMNSWGTGWGMQGFFTIPYAYLTNPNLAADFWTVYEVELISPKPAPTPTPTPTVSPEQKPVLDINIPGIGPVKVYVPARAGDLASISK